MNAIGSNVNNSYLIPTVMNNSATKLVLNRRISVHWFKPAFNFYLANTHNDIILRSHILLFTASEEILCLLNQKIKCIKDLFSNI